MKIQCSYLQECIYTEVACQVETALGMDTKPFLVSQHLTSTALEELI